MLTAEHGWCSRDDVRSVFSTIGGVAANQPFLNPPRWHLTFAQNQQCLMAQLVLRNDKSWLDYGTWGDDLCFHRTPIDSRPHISLAGRNDRWNSALIEFFIRKVQAAHLAVTHGQHLNFELEDYNNMHWYTTTVPVVVAPMGMAIRRFSDPYGGRRAALFSSNSELIRQIRNLLFILGVAAGAQGDVVEPRVTLPQHKFIALGDLHIMCDQNQPPPPPGTPPGFVHPVAQVWDPAGVAFSFDA